MAYTKPKKYNKVRFTHHFWRDIASGASYASYTSKTLTIGFGIRLLQNHKAKKHPLTDVRGVFGIGS